MDDAQERSPYRCLPARTLRALMTRAPAPRVIDIREPHEWRQGRLEGAECLPLSELRHWWLTLDPSAPVVFCCQSGSRSRALCQALAAAGFTALSDVEGGVEACLGPNPV